MTVNNFDRSNWAFWVRAAHWTAEEAAIILCGIIPQSSGEEEQVEGRPPSFHHYLDIYGGRHGLELVNRKFPNNIVQPSAFFAWARDFALELPKELIEEAAKFKSLAVNSNDFASSSEKPIRVENRGAHHAQKRYAILCAAIRFIDSQSKEKFATFYKPGGSSNIQAISNAIVDTRSNFSGLGDENSGPTAEHIYETISDATQANPKKLPK